MDAPDCVPICGSTGITIPRSIWDEAWISYAKKYGNSQSQHDRLLREGFYVEELDILRPGWGPTNQEIATLRAQLAAAQEENARLEKWVDDLQSGLWINCVYCGHRYGPKETTPVTMRKALYDHVAQCEKHPLFTALARISALEAVGERLYRDSNDTRDESIAARLHWRTVSAMRLDGTYS